MEIRGSIAKSGKNSPRAAYRQPDGFCCERRQAACGRMMQPVQMVPAKTETLLYAVGLSANYVGYKQLAAALEIAAQQPESLCMVTKWLYPETARRCGTSWSAVERNLRLMLGIVWERSRQELERLAGRAFAEKPTPAQFLAVLLHILSNMP